MTIDPGVQTALISAFSAGLVAAITAWASGRARKRPDATEIGRTGLSVIPEMGDKVLEALDRVNELTEAVAEAKEQAIQARAEAATARAEASAVRTELAAAKREIEELRDENYQLRVERDDYKQRLRLLPGTGS